MVRFSRILGGNLKGRTKKVTIVKCDYTTTSRIVEHFERRQQIFVSFAIAVTMISI